jgi:thioesterase domain-containing protein
MDEMYSSRPDLMDTPFLDPELKLIMDRRSFEQAEGKRSGLQSSLLMTYRLKPYHKDGPHKELNFGHWSRHYNTQKEKWVSIYTDF